MRSFNLVVKRYAAPSHLCVAVLILISLAGLWAESVPRNLSNGDIVQQCGPVGGPGEQVIDFQWNDPYAYTKQSIGQLLLNEKGQLPSPVSSITYHFQTTADNTLVRIEAGPVQTGGPDVSVAIYDSQGKLLFSAPDYRTPTELGLPATGAYSVVVVTADSPVAGEFYVKINQVKVTPAPEISSNFNLLLFDITGTCYVGQAVLQSGRAE